jgi:large subunit ribosomal protein L35
LKITIQCGDVDGAKKRELKMPKMKTHSGAKKRFIITKSGKVKHKKMGLRHLLTGMSSNRGRKLHHSAILDKTNDKIIRMFMPYGRKNA